MSREPQGSTRWTRATRAVSAGRPEPGPSAPVNEPITLSATFHAGGPVSYGREGNPTWAALEATMAELEDGAGAVAFGSGLAAINAVLDLVPTGGVVLVPTHPYPGTRARLHELAEQGRVVVREYTAGPELDLGAALHDVALLWIESPTNPLLEISDVDSLCAQARAAGVMTVVDSTFTTPLRAQPLTVGADVVVHSATKYLAGHSDVLLGIAVASDADLVERLRIRRAALGSVPSPFDAWLTLRGIRTLAVRMDRAVANAGVIAERLTQHPGVTTVLYPGLPQHPGHTVAMASSGSGAVVCCVLADGDTAETVCSSTRLWTHGTSLGGVESLIERRSRWPFEHPDVPAGLIRLSVGIEDVEDLWDDLDAALPR